MTTPLLRCAHCGVASPYTLQTVERDRGEWLLRCLECGAENILALSLSAKIELPVFEIVGWRDSKTI
jgi:uncharacterized Zn finger protein